MKLFKVISEIQILIEGSLESTSLYEEIILSMASAELMSRLRAVVKALVLSLTPPSGSSSTLEPKHGKSFKKKRIVIYCTCFCGAVIVHVCLVIIPRLLTILGAFFNMYTDIS